MNTMIIAYYDILTKYIKYYFKHKSFNKIIFINGLYTLTEIFKFTVVTNKNIVECCDKSIYYYFEFILQLQNNNNELLNLTTKDAAIFCFKKFFNDITNNDIHYNYKIAKSLLINTNIILSIILHDNIDNDAYIFQEFKDIIQKLDSIPYQTSECIYNFINHLYKFKLNQCIFISKIDEFVSIIKKYPNDDINTISNKIYHFSPEIKIKSTINNILSNLF